MKRFFICSFCVLILCISFGCDQDQAEFEKGKVPVEVKKAEAADSTRLDSADTSDKTGDNQ